MADWFSSLASQAMKLADDFADSLVAQANEAQEQIQREQAKLREEDEQKKVTLNTNTQLPWETQDEALQILSDALMDSILKLSLNERNFTVAPSNVEEIHFVFSDFIATALHLLKLDTNLAHVHSKVSPKMDEEIFWRNYYGRVVYLRAACGIDGTAAQEGSSKWKSQDIVFEPDYLQSKPIIPQQGSSGNLKVSLVGAKKSPPKRSGSNLSPAAATATAGTGADLLGDLHDLDDLDELTFGTAAADGASGRGGEGQELGLGGEEGGEQVEEDEEEVDLGDIDLADLDDELDLLRELREMEEEEEEEDVDSGSGSGVQVSEQGTPAAGAGSGKSKGKGKGKGREVGELGSYEEVGKSDCTSSTSNAELEAQIAAELANISDDDD